MKGILSDNFLEKYKNSQSPLSPMGEFVYLRTYSSYLIDKKRRESWYETVLRTTEYNISLGIKYKEKMGLPIKKEEEIKEAEKLFDNLYNLRSFTSGRTLYMGGREIVDEYPLSNYNCAYTNIEKLGDLIDVFYLLMIGSGVGVGIRKEYMDKFPKLRKVDLDSLYDGEVGRNTPKEEKENSSYKFDPDKFSVTILVGDSKEGWCQALEMYFDFISLDKYSEIKKIIIDYSYVRPEGERLKRFGGRASGHGSLKRMFGKINKVVSRLENGRLRTIDLLDFATIISENVVSGGVRRSAMMVICDEDDEEVINAKRNIYKVVDGKWIEDSDISHRMMSNNSVLYTERPSLERIKEIVNNIKINGEPGFINGGEALRRKGTFQGTNPCGEILLQSKQCCNLTTNNLMAFVNGNELDQERLEEVLRLSARVAIRMTLVDLELAEWNKVMKEDRIVGISLTGIMDMVNKTGMSFEDLAVLLRRLRQVVHQEGDRYCKELGINKPSLMTTIKPEGTLSTLPGVSSGIHFAHSNYYVRRIRISATDPLYKMIEAQGSYPIYNENGQTDENCTTKVIEFPIKAAEGRTKYDVSAIEQLELYKMTMENWTDHNTSITVHVRDYEWDDVVEWMYTNFEYIVGITFIPLGDESYPLMPYESITKEEYEKRLKSIKPIDYQLLEKLEDDEEHDILEDDCEGGLCPVR